MVGRSIAHYTVVEKLGEGGMGAVYEARDTHLDRFVAIKVLPADRVADEDRRRRFVQEAKAASALNHPNIVHIYDIDRTEGLDYIAMEYVQGRTLDQLIGRKGLKLPEALSCSIQITDALAKAHGAGIVHRDLKPSNIMVTPDGLVKVLDFGLAKLTQSEPEEDDATRTLKPTTEEGTIVGTAAYMSPEQAEGKPVDARSDIFSFGSVFYEMLTGQRAFRGESKMSTLAAILHKDPKPASEISAALPAEVERVLSRCLRKDPARRFQHMDDIKVALADLKEESESGKLPAPAQQKASSRRWWWLAAAGLAVAAVVGGAIWWSNRRPPAALDLKVERFTFDPGITFTPALSWDGKIAAYASDRSGDGNLDIYVQHTSGGQPNRLTRHEADDYSPSFSPDGSRIAFRSERDGGGIYVIDTFGGTERKLVAGGWAPSFSPDGSTIAYATRPPTDSPADSRMFLIPSQGGQPRPLHRQFGVGSTSVGSSDLFWSPDGKHLLFPGMRVDDPASTDWWVAPVAGGTPVATGAMRNLPHGVGFFHPLAWFGGHVYFCRGTLVEGIHIFRAPISSNTWQISGPEQRLTSGGGTHRGAAIASDGRMLFSSLNPGVDFWAFPLERGKPAVSGNPLRATSDATIKGHGSLSRDGKLLAYVAFVSWQAPRIEIRLRNLSTGAESAYVSKTLPGAANPQISPDGSTIAYTDTVNGKAAVFVGPAGNLPGKQVCENCNVVGFFSDSRRVLVAEGAKKVARLDPATGTRTPVLDTGSASLHNAQFAYDVRPSYDDRWIAFTVDVPGGDLQSFIAPVGDSPSPEKEWIRFAGGGDYAWSPLWAPGGDLVYYMSNRDGHACIWAQRLDPGTKKPVGVPFNVHHLHRPEASDAGFSRSMFLLGSPDKLMVNVWSMTSNLWMTKLEAR